MKSVLLAATLAMLAPSAALAQVAAGSVPDPFAPGARPQTPVVAQPQASEPANPRSEELLRSVITGLQAGTLDYGLMTDELATRIKAREGELLLTARGFGALQALDFMGVQSGADMFAGAFANAETQWMIGVNADGKIGALLFREVGDEAEDPDSAAPAR